MTTSSANNSVFRGFFKKQKLIGPDFINCYRQLRIVLSIEDKLNYLEQPIPFASIAPAGQHVSPEILAAHNARIKGSKEIAGLMLMTIEPDIQRNMESLHAHEMLRELKTIAFGALGHPVTLGLGKGNWHKKSQSQMAAKGQSHRKGKNKQDYAPKPKISPPPKREDPKKNAASGAGGSSIFVIELNTILNRSWIYDTGCGTHICNTTQGLRASRKLKPRALSLYMGNGQRELEIVLNNCHYAPSITRGVVSVSRLYEDGFVNRFVNNTIQVSRNNMVYFSSIPRDDIFKIDLSNSYTNESSIYAVSNKRAKLDLDSALLWHCCLRHISKKRIEKLQHDGLLDSFDLRAFKKCVSFMSGKMARKP
uniref:Zinc finger, CCHC-type n=1 Tax=Tanacetum cinerariifolium TaxID=118510 RepID=A0A6L2LI08_TANCI|nr:zinc finger, CCHC-type [Tanacetum cinerariifolium]